MEHRAGIYEKYIKRLLDIVCSLFAIIILGIPMVIIAILVKKKIGSPVLFKQKRIGKDNKEFMLLKFRSMTEDRDENGVYLPDPERLNSFGRKIRALSIDELPSLFNILKGDMSVIGPRPLPVRYLERYDRIQIRRHEVKPGFSSPAMMNGRVTQPWEEQFKQEVWYVDNISFMLDFKTVLRTILIVLKRDGVTAEDGDCRAEFIGIADVNELTDSENNYMKIERN